MALAPEYPILHNFGWGAFWFFLGLGPFPWVISRIDDLVSDDDSTEVLYWVSKSAKSSSSDWERGPRYKPC